MSSILELFMPRSLAALVPNSTISVLITLLLVIPLMVSYTAQASRTYFPNLKNAGVLLLTAHPDDEVMFFAPTILALTSLEAGNHLKVLCLSRGNADGLGDVREKELKDSCKRLGLREQDSICLEDKQLQDGFHSWNSTYVRDMLLRFFTQNDGKVPTIDAIVTFDAGGVSGHPNHKSVFEAAKAFADSLHGRIGGAGWEVPVAVYSLTSVNILRKYGGALDIVSSVGMSMVHIVTRKDKGKPGLNGLKARNDKQKERKVINGEGGRMVEMGSLPTHLLYVSGLGDWMTSLGAMTKGHKSQMVWFRWGWVSLGRYLWVNDLRRVR